MIHFHDKEAKYISRTELGVILGPTSQIGKSGTGKNEGQIPISYMSAHEHNAHIGYQAFVPAISYICHSCKSPLRICSFQKPSSLQRKSLPAGNKASHSLHRFTSCHAACLTLVLFSRLMAIFLKAMLTRVTVYSVSLKRPASALGHTGWGSQIRKNV